MKNILIVGMTPTHGGIESFLMNYYRNIDKNKFHFDFLCIMMEKIAYEDELKERGSCIYHISSKRKGWVKYKKQIFSFFKENAYKYDVIWVNVNSLANIDFFKLAKKFGINRRIVHSHNSSNMGGKINLILHNIHKKIISKYATDFWACSQAAAEWFYEGKIRDSVEIINNAIDVSKYCFCEKKRREVRETLGWQNEVIWGNIGRLHFQKNQLYILDLLKEYIKVNPNTKLVLVGEGPDEPLLYDKINEYKLNEYVKIMGAQEDIQAYLSAFDIFVFPSKFEGLSVVVLEAQANGIPIVASEDAINKTIMWNRNIYLFKLTERINAWCCGIDKALEYGRISKENSVKCFYDNGYIINDAVKRLEQIFAEPNNGSI